MPEDFMDLTLQRNSGFVSTSFRFSTRRPHTALKFATPEQVHKAWKRIENNNPHHCQSTKVRSGLDSGRGVGWLSKQTLNIPVESSLSPSS